MKRLAVLIAVNAILVSTVIVKPWQAEQNTQSLPPLRTSRNAEAKPYSGSAPSPVIWARLFIRPPTPRPAAPIAAQAPAEPALQVTGILFDGSSWQVIGRRPDGRPVALRSGELFDGWRLARIDRSVVEFERAGVVWSASLEPKP